MTAYLVAVLDTNKSPPVVVDVGIFSSSARELTTVGGGNCYADLTEYPGRFDQATEGIMTLLRSPYAGPLKWALPFLEAKEAS